MKIRFFAMAILAAVSFCLPTTLHADEKAPAATNAPSAPAAPAVATPAAPKGRASPEGRAATNEVPSGSIEVMRLVLTESIQDHDPGPEITTAKVADTVIAWNQIRSGLGDVTITHRWLHESENTGDVPLHIGGSPWRTWSRKTVSEPGNWKVQVLNSDGSVLKETAFTVTEAATAPEAPAAK